MAEGNPDIHFENGESLRPEPQLIAKFVDMSGGEYALDSPDNRELITHEEELPFRCSLQLLYDETDQSAGYSLAGRVRTRNHLDASALRRNLEQFYSEERYDFSDGMIAFRLVDGSVMMNCSFELDIDNSVLPVLRLEVEGWDSDEQAFRPLDFDDHPVDDVVGEIGAILTPLLDAAFRDQLDKKNTIKYAWPGRSIRSGFEQTTSKELVQVAVPEIPEVRASLDELWGLDETVGRLRDVTLQIQHPEIFEYYDVEPTRRILLHGPGGVGKTSLVRAFAAELNMILQEAKGSDIISKWVGESNKNLAQAFESTREAKEPTILFIDEFDGMFSQSGVGNSGVDALMVSQLKQSLTDPRNQGVIFMAAANSIDTIDPVILRAGRFDAVIGIPLPNEQSRRAIWNGMIFEHDRLYDFDDITTMSLSEELARQSEGFSGAEIREVLKRTRLAAALRDIRTRQAPTKIIPDDIKRTLTRYRTERVAQDD